MDHISGEAREQMTLFPDAIEDYVAADNPVRFLDAYVDRLDMSAFGFEHAMLNETGRPPYNPKDLLKLYLYGYLNRIRSSRLLERESHRNLEVLWLLRRLSPDHKTISNFRRMHATALRKVFLDFVMLCRTMELFGAELVAIDSTKFTASNSRDRVKTKAQLAKTLARINDSISHYLSQLDTNDAAEHAAGVAAGTATELQRKIHALEQQRTTMEQAAARLEQTDESTASLTDPDCRLMKNERRIEPAYAVHTSVDAQHSLIVDYEITQDAADVNHLTSLACNTKNVFGTPMLSVCADAGYYDSVELKQCADHDITTYIPTPAQKVSKKTNTPTPEYYHERFAYEHGTDTYRCPQGQPLTRFSAKRKEDGRRLLLYHTAACAACPVRTQCTTSPRGRYITRWEHEPVLEQLRQRVAEHPEIIKQRKELIEHVFGTIKKIWGYGSLLLRGLSVIPSEIALCYLSYNIRRTINIVGVKQLLAVLQ